jgi:hypothetical protein
MVPSIASKFHTSTPPLFSFSLHVSAPTGHLPDALGPLVYSAPTVLGYRCRGPGFDSQALQKKIVGLERGPLSLMSTTEELLDRKVAAPV